MELRNDIFIIPSDEFGNIVYAPLRRCVFTTNDVAARIIHKYKTDQLSLSESEMSSPVWERLSEIEKINPLNPSTGFNVDLNNLTILLTDQCNLACTYCYSKQYRASTILSQRKLQLAIDYVFSNNYSTKKRFTFIGGGEPTLAWDRLEWAIKYIRQKTDNSQSVYISLITNGTLLSNERIDFLSRNNINIVFSYDILPFIQNKQRPMRSGREISHETVNNVIINSIKRGATVKGIRATITRESVNKMVDMVEYVNSFYPSIKLLDFELVTNTANPPQLYSDYIYWFFESVKTASSYGITLYNSITMSFNSLKTRFCQREFSLTPNGDITSCHRVSSHSNQNYDLFKIGHISEAIQLEKTIPTIKQLPTNCFDCFAKWHCAGGCISDRMQLSVIQQEEKCKFTKEIIKRLLELKLKKELYHG